MANLAIQGHKTRGKEVIEILEMLGGKNPILFKGDECKGFYFIDNKVIRNSLGSGKILGIKCFTLEEFLEKFPYKVGDKVLYYENPVFITQMEWIEDSVAYHFYYKGRELMLPSKHLQPYKEQEPMEKQKLIPSYMDYDVKTSKQEPMEDKGNISDGYHTFNELYEYRLLYNASMFNELAKQGLYDVHKSKLHSDGTIPFEDENWFIVQAELPTGQISNHYEIKDWDLFQVPVKEKANLYDGHSPQDVAKRLREFLTPKPQYPKTYEECCRILDLSNLELPTASGYGAIEIEALQQLRVCRDAYWKVEGWNPKIKGERFYMNSLPSSLRDLFPMPTEEMRYNFYNNFNKLLEACKEL